MVELPSVWLWSAQARDSSSSSGVDIHRGSMPDALECELKTADIVRRTEITRPIRLLEPLARGSETCV